MKRPIHNSDINAGCIAAELLQNEIVLFVGKANLEVLE